MIAIIDWNPILLAFIGFLGTTVTALVGYLTIKLAKVGKVLDTVHALTNSAMTAQKRTLAEVTASKFAITKDPVDGQAAELAMKDWLSQASKQGNVNAEA